MSVGCWIFISNRVSITSKIAKIYNNNIKLKHLHLKISLGYSQNIFDDIEVYNKWHKKAFLHYHIRFYWNCSLCASHHSAANSSLELGVATPCHMAIVLCIFLTAHAAQRGEELTLTPSCPSVSAPSLYSVERSTFTCSYSPFGRQAILFFFFPRTQLLWQSLFSHLKKCL